MNIKTIKKTIEINTPKENVWKVLLEDQFTRLWYAEFSEGTYADTYWEIGSKVLFIDHSKCGIAGKVVANTPQELLSVEYHGVISNGVEDYESEAAKQVKGSFETYRITENAGLITLDISSDMGEKYFDMMNEAWDRALQKIKQLADN